MSAPQNSADPLAALAHKCWATLETLHVVAYFAAEPASAYGELGLRGRTGYFASRSAAMGPVSPEVTVATFYVFAPALVRHVMVGVWDLASPEQVLAARHRGVGQALHRLLGDVDVTEAAALARSACEGLSPQGRALYAAHAALPWPDDPMLALWHAGTLLREHRGDGHVAAMLLAGLDPVEATITGGLAAGTTGFLRATRGWSEQEWSAGEARLRERGLLDGAGQLTEQGGRMRTDLEARTATAARAGWAHLGGTGATRLLELTRPLRRAITDSDLMPAELRARRVPRPE